MRNFKSLDIRVESIKLVQDVYNIVERFPKNELYNLHRQMTRAAVSIPSNIAEGCSRKSQKEFKRFLEIALGSAFELETQIIILAKIELANKVEINQLSKDIIKLQKRIYTLNQKIKY